MSSKFTPNLLSRLVAIQSLDSDGDGFTNIQEITAFTFPGDPNNLPSSGATPTSTMAPPTATRVPSVTTTPPTGTMQSSPTQHGYPPPQETETGEPHGTRTSRPTYVPGLTHTPRPTGQPTVCPTNNNRGEDSGFMSTPGSPDDRNGMRGRPTISCVPAGGGDDGGDRGGGGGGKGGGGGGGDAVVAPSGLIAFFDSLLGIH